MMAIARRIMSALGLSPCPKCGCRKIAIKHVARPLGQKDGFEGSVYTCKKCGNSWLERVVPTPII